MTIKDWFHGKVFIKFPGREHSDEGNLKIQLITRWHIAIIIFIFGIKGKILYKILNTLEFYRRVITESVSKNIRL